MKHYKAIGFLIGAALLANTVGASAQRWGRETTPRAGVCFYEDINFGGRYFCSAAGAATSDVPSGTNDEISSVRLFGNATLTVFRDPGLRGQSKVIDSDISDLRRMGFNDRISSYRVDTGRGFDRGIESRGDRDRGNGNVRAREQSNRSRWTVTEAQALVRRSYRSVLDRDPDPSGLRSWTDQVINNDWTQRDLENALRNTDEYRNLRSNRRR
jgi:hypothetical protein